MEQIIKLPTVFLHDGELVIAVFLNDVDANIFASATNHKYCAMPFNVNNRDRTPLPQVGQVYRD